MAKLSRDRFSGSVITLLSGSALAQVVTVAVLPVLTRVFTPSDFNIYAIYVAVVGVFSVIACLRLDVAIPIPENERDAVCLLLLAMVSSLVVSFFVGFGLWLYFYFFNSSARFVELSEYLWLIFIGVWLSSSYSALQYWAIRRNNFLSIAKTRLLQSISSAAVQLILGGAGFTPIGLLLGQAVNGGAGILRLATEAWKEIKLQAKSLHAIDLVRALRKNIDFPKYSVPDALANALSIQAPLVIIGFFALGAEAGFLLLAMRIMQGPLSMLGNAVSQVYLSKASDANHSGTLGQLTGDVINRLCKFGIGPIIFIGLVADPFAGIILGPGWERVGVLMLWMTPWSVMQFMASPISTVMYVRNRQRTMLALTSFGLTLKLLAMWLSGVYFPEAFSEFYAVACAGFYFVCLIVFFRVAGLGASAVYKNVNPSILIFVFWAVLGVAVRVISMKIIGYDG